MNSFEKILLRLKEHLNIQTDKKIAELLDIKPSSFNDRKKRDSFPIDKLLTLDEEQPNLGIDLGYVLTGKSKEQMTRAEAKRLGIFKPDAYVAQAIASVGGDDDENRDDEPFTMNTPPIYRLNKDEWELIQRFRGADLTTKMQVMQLLLSVDMTEKSIDDYKPETTSSSSQTFYGKVTAGQVSARDITNYGKRRK